jgi:hypothetical protein
MACEIKGDWHRLGERKRMVIDISSELIEQFVGDNTQRGWKGVDKRSSRRIAELKIPCYKMVIQVSHLPIRCTSS